MIGLPRRYSGVLEQPAAEITIAVTQVIEVQVSSRVLIHRVAFLPVAVDLVPILPAAVSLPGVWVAALEDPVADDAKI